LRLKSDLPKDRDSVRRQHSDLEAEEKSLGSSIAARRAALKQSQHEIDEHTRQRDRVQQELNGCRVELQTQLGKQDNFRQALTRYLKELPESWQQAVSSAKLLQMNEWTHERDQLVLKDTERRANELRQARLAVEGLQRDCRHHEEQLAAFPEEARHGPQAVQQLLKDARDRHRQRDEALGQARQQMALLEMQHSQREQLQREHLAADGELKHWKLLAELLGRDRLQLHLVRQAERQVVDHANAVLDRLSGGELYLRLCGEAGGEGNSAKALELEAHNRVTGEKPINVAFLSGSQKFRVAVSLALGIGQYASRQHRPIESVIIDEGFGCLDRNARQVMIQELQNLRSQMRCILPVSHQEEFADAFADGYHFELQNGTTVARRFQR
jgi:DNA repair exonuclease SbcCD ATPase subunit